MDNNIKSQIDLLKAQLPNINKEIVARLYELQPKYNDYGDKGLIHSLEDGKNNLAYLFASIETDSIALFQNYYQWTHKLFININLPTDTLEYFYNCTKEVFREKFIGNLIAEELYLKIVEYIECGIRSTKVVSNQKVDFGGYDNPLKETLLRYSSFILSGDKHSATSLILDTVRDNVELKNIYKYIFQPFQIELGRLWHENLISVAEEHYATAVSQFAMSLLYEKIFSIPKNNKVFLGTCVCGELHEFGIRMICDYVESCGWNTYYLGANMPNRDVIKMIKERKPDIVAISCTMIINIPKVRNLIEDIKGSKIYTPIIVGGYPFNLDNDLWKRIGADASSGDFEEAFQIAEKFSDGGKNGIF